VWHRFEDSANTLIDATNALGVGANQTAFDGGTVNGSSFVQNGGVTDVVSAQTPSGAYQYDGVDDRAILDSRLSFSSRKRFTLTLNFAPDTSGSGRSRILCQGSGGSTNNNASLALHEFDGNTFRVEAYDKSSNIGAIQGGSTTTGQYTQVFVTFDTGSFEVFQDDSNSIGTFSVGSSELQQSPLDIAIGFNNQLQQAFFEGRVDDFRLYNRVVPSAERKQINQNTKLQ
jgi:hypothetical protein